MAVQIRNRTPGGEYEVLLKFEKRISKKVKAAGIQQVLMGERGE